MEVSGGIMDRKHLFADLPAVLVEKLLSEASVAGMSMLETLRSLKKIRQQRKVLIDKGLIIHESI